MIKKAIKWTDQWDDRRRRDISAKNKNDKRLTEEPRLDHKELMKHVTIDIKGLEELDLDEDGAIGYVYKSLGATIFLLRSAMRQLKNLDFSAAATLIGSGKLFEQLITDLVMEPGDADTNACPAAAVLGAYLGYQAIPQYWRDGLKHGGFLKHKVHGLCQMFGVSEGIYNGKEDAHTAPDGGNGFLTQGGDGFLPQRRKRRTPAPEPEPEVELEPQEGSSSNPKSNTLPTPPPTTKPKIKKKKKKM